MIYSYKGIDYQVHEGSRGGLYIIVDDKKKYVKSKSTQINSQKKNNSVAKFSYHIKPQETRRNNTRNTISKEIIPEYKYLECYVSDPEHEGDIDYEKRQLSKIGNYEIVQIDREYTEDGEELTYACINIKVKAEDYNKFAEYCNNH